MISKIQTSVREGNYRFTSHAIERCIERDICPAEIKEAINSGEIIESYPHDKYGPTCLIRGITKRKRILHILCSLDPVWIITAYDPTLSPEEWDKNFRIRRKKT